MISRDSSLSGVEQVWAYEMDHMLWIAEVGRCDWSTVWRPEDCESNIMDTEAFYRFGFWFGVVLCFHFSLLEYERVCSVFFFFFFILQEPTRSRLLIFKEILDLDFQVLVFFFKSFQQWNWKKTIRPCFIFW